MATENNGDTGTVVTSAVVHLENGHPTAALVDLAPGEALTGEVLEPETVEEIAEVIEEVSETVVAVAEIEAETERHISDNEAAVALAAIEAQNERDEGSWRHEAEALQTNLRELSLQVETLASQLSALASGQSNPTLSPAPEEVLEPETISTPPFTSDGTSETPMEASPASEDERPAPDQPPARRRRARLI
jgi:hypothetical protein